MASGHDQRDSQTWVVIELTRAGEAKVEEGLIADLLRRALSVEAAFPVFVPSVSYLAGNRRTTLHLMEGYVFVATGLPEVQYLNLEGACPYVRKVLTARSPSGMRVLSVVPDTGVQEMRQQLAQHLSSDVVTGMRVEVTEGVYARLEGEVVCVSGADAFVRFQMRSIDLLATVPLVFLTPVDGEES